MASVFLYHVVGDLTVGKPELSEFSETETVGAAIGAIGDSAEGGIPVWRKRSVKSPFENAQSRQQRFIGILNALDIVAFLARDDCLADQEKAINTPVSEIVTPANSALKVVDPGTRFSTLSSLLSLHSLSFPIAIYFKIGMDLKIILDGITGKHRNGFENHFGCDLGVVLLMLLLIGFG